MKNTFFIFALLSCLLIFLCVSVPQIERQEQMTEITPIYEIKTSFTKEELLADFDQCWEILEGEYPFFPVLEKHGIDVQGLQETYRKTLEDRITDVKGFYVLLRQMFATMENFAHLEMIDPGKFQIRVEQGVQDPQAEATYEVLSGDSMGSTGSTGYAKKIVETEYYPDEKAAYFHFHTFYYAMTEFTPEESAVACYLKQLEEEGLPVEHVIIDVTGNRGGYTYNAIKDILAPLGGGTWKSRIYFEDSPGHTELLISRLNGNSDGYYATEEPKALTGDPSEPAFTKELGMTHFAEVEAEYPSFPNTYAEDARRWLLIDEGCYSMSEVLTDFCKDTGWATVVGRRTRGDGCVFGPKTVRLDQTGLMFRMTTYTRANTEGSLNAEQGEKPDIVCKSGETPLKKCLELINTGIEDDA